MIASDDVEHLGRRAHDDHEIDRVGYVEQRCVRRKPLDDVGLRVDRVDSAAEAELEQVAHDGVADLARMRAGADDRDGARFEQPGDRRGFGFDAATTLRSRKSAISVLHFAGMRPSGL